MTDTLLYGARSAARLGEEAVGLIAERGSEDSPALVTESGEAISFGQLRESVRQYGRELPDSADGPRLVHVPLRPDLVSVTTYLATVEAGHVALVTSEDDQAKRILDRYLPDVRATGDVRHPFTVETFRPRHVLHPRLALLLSTSGSTGSPKLVRLSQDNLISNARAIADTLRLRVADRGMTSLPLSYCFGLSVLHSHLVAGASTLLHDGSVLNPSFWRAVDEFGVTNLGVVPHMVELMETTRVLEEDHPSLRLLAQAGGRMHPERVRRTVELGAKRGWGLAVMYGQTEATARICVLDPSLVRENPDAVGQPLPGTALRIDTTVPEASRGIGEVVVTGPGVMMGYAEHPDDLAVGRMLAELRTGDLGEIGADGLLRIRGRRSGFVKVLGVRIDLASVERALERVGYTACVGGDGSRLLIAVEPHAHVAADRTAREVRKVAGRASGLGTGAVRVAVEPLPRLTNGKIDRLACAQLVQAHEPMTGVRDIPRGVAVARAVGEVLGLESVDLDSSFVQLGGDSLSHVQATARLEALVGALPVGWQHRPLSELTRVSPSRGDGTPDGEVSARRPGRLARWRSVETSVFLRAVAVVAICGSHSGLFHFLGGAHILLAVAGFSAARFGLSLPSTGARWRATARTLLGIAVPTVLMASYGMVVLGRYGWGNVLLSNWLIGDTTKGSTRNEYWFIDALVAGILVFMCVLSVPFIARAWRRHPWRVAVGFTAAALVPRFFLMEIAGQSDMWGIMPTTLWLLGVGAAAAFADTRARQIVTVLLALAGGVTFFDDPLRNLTVLVGLACLVLLPSVRLPSWLVPVITLLASASLYVYLVQFMVLSALENDLLETLAAIAAGCLLWRVADKPVRRLQTLVPLPPR